MNKRTEELIKLMDQALLIAEGRLREQTGKYETEALKAIIEGLHYWREQAINGKLAPSEGSQGLGLSRAVLDWDAPDSSLVKATGEIDKYYRENF